MAAKVFLHIGLPKTGTTYLQGVMWDHRELMRSEGVLIPGKSHREHLWAALDVQERKNLASRHPKAPGAWGRLVAGLSKWPETGVVSHEFFCGASAEQASRVLADLAPAEVHLVITARHALGMLTAGWQESIKNGGTRGLRDIPKGPGPGSEFGWRTWDLAGVLERWGGQIQPDRVHILPVPGPGEPPDQHWRNFAGVVGLTQEYALPEEAANPSLGVVQVELLRRINAELEGFTTAADRGVWIRGYLAEEHLVRQPGVRLGPGPGQVTACRRRSDRAVALIRERGYDVVGDVERLLVPDDLPDAPSPDKVSNAELVDAAAVLVAGMLTDVRALKQEVVQLRRGHRSIEATDNTTPARDTGT